MARLGKRQLELMSVLAGINRAVVVPGKLTASLCRRGLMVSIASKTDGFLALTADGYRAVADALDAGTIKREDLRAPRAAA